MFHSRTVSTLATPSRRPRWRRPRHHPFEILGNPEYRRYWLAGLLSFTGFSVQLLARSWLMHVLTGSPFMVAMVMVALVLPMLPLSLVGGLLADRFDRRRITLLAEMSALLGYTLLAVLVVMGVVEAWHVLALSAFNGTAGALAVSARQSMISSLVPKNDLRTAVGLSAVVFNVSQIVGPALGGVVIASLGMEAALIISAAFVIPSIALYWTLKPTPLTVKPPSGVTVVQNLRAGFVHIANDPALRWLLLGAMVMVLSLNSWQALMPVFADTVLGADAGGLGLLVLAAGVGALAGTLVVVSVGARVKHETLQIGGGFLMAASVAAFALSPWMATSIIFAAMAGFFATVFFVTNMTVVQVNAPEELRGRIMSVRFLVIGLQPIGTLGLGAAAEVVGAPYALAGFALAGALAFGLVQLVARPTAQMAPSAPLEAIPQRPAPSGGADNGDGA